MSLTNLKALLNKEINLLLIRTLPSGLIEELSDP